MRKKRVRFKHVYASKFKSDAENTYVLEWNRKDGFTWISEYQDDRFLEMFASCDGIEKAVSTSLLHENDRNEIKELDCSKELRKIYLERAVRLRFDTSDYKWYKISFNNFFDHNGSCSRCTITAIDIQNMVKGYENMQYRIEYDMLTKIYNADKFYKMVAETIHKNPDLHYALIRMDIDRFKVINDMLGVDEGNRLLMYIADTIRRCYKPGYLYCRINSDIFCLCISYENKQEIIALIKWLEEKIDHYNMNFKIVPAFGIYRIDEPNVPVSVMLDRAKLASKSVKGSLFSNYAFYNNALRNKIMQEIEIEGYMNKALENHEFKIFLQPKYDISTSAIVGAEVLCRWIHPTRGLIAPNSFIPLFEKNGFIIQLDYYMWEETCKLIRRWLDEGRDIMTVSMNVSRMHVYNAQFENQIIQLMDRYKIPQKLLELELTESAFLENENEIYQIMGRLKNKGFLFSIDDFGSGYSSLNMLKSVPIDIVKLDRGFLNEVSVSTKGKEIIRYTIAMARQLNLKVIAEGVENVEQAAFLLETGCNTAQGYYYCKPLPIIEFEKFAFNTEKETVLDESIKSVIQDKAVILDEIREIQDDGSMQDFFRTSAFTYDEMNSIQNNFVKILKKYRTAIFGSNVVFYEIDLKKNKVISSYHEKGFESQKPVKTYQDFVEYITERCEGSKKNTIKNTLSLQNLQSLIEHKENKIIFDYKMKTITGGEFWLRATIILDTDKNGILDTLILCSTNIDEPKKLNYEEVI